MTYNKRKAGDHNTGDWNVGYWNVGNWNIGNWNFGYCNTGDWNTGDWIIGNWNAITPQDCYIFNKPAKISDWKNFKKPEWMYFPLTQWIHEDDMTDKEKEAYPSYVAAGGYLKAATSYENAAIESWNNTTQEDRELTLKLPNFDDKVFKEIFGFSAVKELEGKKRTINIDRKEIEISEESYQSLKNSLK